LKIDVEIKINNRKILVALAETCGNPEKLIDITVAIDKLDKIGIEKVKEELAQRGLDENQICIVEKYVNISGTNENRLKDLNDLIGNIEIGKKGIKELLFVINSMPMAQKSKLVVDFTLARGLNYYTGTIYEVKAKNAQMGSIGGGGRYDDLTGLFGVPNIPGVGISFGVDRIYDVMEELKLFPEAIHVGTKGLFFNLGEQESKIAFELMQVLRKNKVASELFHENAKFDKQFKYADKKNIPYAIIIGSKELIDQTCTIKHLKTGEQQTILQSNITQFNFNQ